MQYSACGFGYTDAHFLASTLLDRTFSLWTRNERLAATTQKVGAALLSFRSYSSLDKQLTVKTGAVVSPSLICCKRLTDAFRGAIKLFNGIGPAMSRFGCRRGHAKCQPAWTADDRCGIRRHRPKDLYARGRADRWRTLKQRVQGLRGGERPRPVRSGDLQPPRKERAAQAALFSSGAPCILGKYTAAPRRFPQNSCQSSVD